MQLYLPESWTSDRARCDRAKIPRDIGFRPKWRIALEMMEHAVKTGLPKGVALADAAYGNVGEFRAGLRWLDFEYAVGVNANTVVTRASKATTDSSPMSGRGAGAHAPTRRVPGDDVEAGKSSRAVVAFRRCSRSTQATPMAVATGCSSSGPTARRRRPTTRSAPSRKAPSRKQLVRITKERWRTDRVYQDLKGELGLDHYEGRSFRGWHHHVHRRPLLLCVRDQRALAAFSPLAREGRVLATRSTVRHERHFRGLLYHRALRHRARPRSMASSMPALSSCPRAFTRNRQTPAVVLANASCRRNLRLPLNSRDEFNLRSPPLLSARRMRARQSRHTAPPRRRMSTPVLSHKKS